MHCIAQACRQRRTQASYAITPCHGPRALKWIYKVYKHIRKGKSIRTIKKENTSHERLEGELAVNLKMQQPLNQEQFCEHMYLRLR